MFFEMFIMSIYRKEIKRRKEAARRNKFNAMNGF